jgi:hypothetical protein
VRRRDSKRQRGRKEEGLSKVKSRMKEEKGGGRSWREEKKGRRRNEKKLCETGGV